MKKKLFILFGVFILIGFSLYTVVIYKLKNNSTYNSNIYHGRGHDIYIPLHSYLKEECCMTVASFYNLKSKEELEKDIQNYLKDFIVYEHGYRKGNLYISNYEVEDKGLYRIIYITY